MEQIKAENLTFSYGNKKHHPQILKGLDFSIVEGESVGLIGANGVGKSTLLKVLTGLQLEYKGILEINGLAMNQKNLGAIRAKTGYVFQDSDSQLFMSTVYEDVAFAPQNYGLGKAEVEKRTMEALRKVHLEEFRDRHVYRLSGGEKKLASIATILSMEPEAILMDEPSVALDPKNRRNLIHVLNELPVTKLIASHDLDFIYDTCERTILLSKGQIAADGKTKQLLTDKELLEANGLELPLSFSRLR